MRLHLLRPFLQEDLPSYATLCEYQFSLLAFRDAEAGATLQPGAQSLDADLFSVVDLAVKDIESLIELEICQMADVDDCYNSPHTLSSTQRGTQWKTRGAHIPPHS